VLHADESDSVNQTANEDHQHHGHPLSARPWLLRYESTAQENRSGTRGRRPPREDGGRSRTGTLEPDALGEDQWGVAGDDDVETNLTSGQYFYAFGLGNGSQIFAGPTWSYDHEAPSDDKLSIPLGIGIARTFLLGRPWKVSLEYRAYIESPDTFGPDREIRFKIAPVVKMPCSG
jgi:hypothetical protein